MSIQSDKQAIVLELGSRFVRCGLSEERAPRCVQRWEVAELLSSHPTVAQCREYLSSQLRSLFFETLHVNPRQRRFLVCEDVTAPRTFRAALMDVLFTHLKIASVTVVPSVLMAQFATSFHTSLIVDCGWKETRVLPVFKGIPLFYMYTSAAVGAASCCDVLRGDLFTPETTSPSIQLEDVLERACFVHPFKDPIMDAADARLHAAGQTHLTIPAHLRGDVTEHLFRDTDTHEDSIVSTVIHVIRKLPIDVRAAMAQNLLVIGGASMLPGFCTRLVDELRASLAHDELSPGPKTGDPLPSTVGLVPLYFPRNMASWIGASVYGATDAARRHVIPLSEYLDAGSRCLPDWMSVAEPQL